VKNGMSFGVNVSAKNAVTVRWNIIHPEGKHFMLGDMENGKLLKSREIKGTGEVMVGATGSMHLSLSVNGGIVPKEFSLGQNYPNPFSEFTSIPVNFTRSTNADVKIIDLIGNEIYSNSFNNVPRGHSTLDVSLGGVTPGIYFYSITAGAHKVSGKMIVK
jgi:hypothetical protein